MKKVILYVLLCIFIVDIAIFAFILKNKKNKVDNIFAKQIDEILNGTFPKRNMLVVSKNTPLILQKIGLKDLPITMTQKHFETITKAYGQYKKANYHNLGIDIVKQLPSAIANPLNILKSNTKSTSVVIVTELSDKNENNENASIKINGKGMVKDIQIDTNVMTSAYGKDNYETFMKNNIVKGNLLYDIDDGIINTINNK